MITTVAISGYRSLRDVVVPLGRLTVVSGANGVGKSNLYRGLRLLAGSGRGSLVRDVAESGGLAALRWAGPEQISRAMRAGEVAVTGTRRREPVRLLLGVASDELGYTVDLGLPQPDGTSAFPHDAEIKCESVFAGPCARPASLLIERTGPRVRQRDGRTWDTLATPLPADRSILAELSTRGPHRRSWACGACSRAGASTTTCAPTRVHRHAAPRWRHVPGPCPTTAATSLPRSPRSSSRGWAGSSTTRSRRHSTPGWRSARWRSVARVPSASWTCSFISPGCCGR